MKREWESGQQGDTWLTIHLAAMTDLHNRNEAMIIVGRVRHAVVALANARVILARQSLMTWRAGIMCKTANTVSDPTKVGLRKSAKLSLSRFLHDQTMRVRHA